MKNPVQTSRLHQVDEVGICIGFVSDDQVKNILRELRGLWRFLDTVRPAGSVRATRDQFGQAWIYINSQALKYLFLLSKDWQEFKITPEIMRADKQATPPMPADFGVKTP